jgi:hypothetical protein
MELRQQDYSKGIELKITLTSYDSKSLYNMIDVGASYLIKMPPTRITTMK